MANNYFTSRSGGKGYQSLQFEASVLGQTSRRGSYTRARRARRPRFVTAAFAAAAVLLGFWAWSLIPDDERALGEMALAVYNGLNAGAGPEAAKAEHAGLNLFPGGSKALAQSDTMPDIFVADSALVEKIRADLLTAGVKWDEAQPLAFGGVRAKVSDGTSDAGVVAVMGNVYFAAGQRVYALEVSAERIDDAYVPTEIWQCVALQAKAEDLKALEAHTQQGYSEFLRENTQTDSPVHIEEAEPVFVAL